MKHEGYTPGPWSYGGKFTRAIFANDGVEVCKLHTRPLPFPSDEAEWLANALLIADAPRLAEEVDRLRGLLKRAQACLSMTDRINAPGLYLDIQAAIEGGE